jgi:hypothetical protein
MVRIIDFFDKTHILSIWQDVYICINEDNLVIRQENFFIVTLNPIHL